MNSICSTGARPYPKQTIFLTSCSAHAGYVYTPIRWTWNGLRNVLGIDNRNRGQYIGVARTVAALWVGLGKSYGTDISANADEQFFRFLQWKQGYRNKLAIIANSSTSTGKPGMWPYTSECHFLYHCNQFKALKLSERHAYNCFSSKHWTDSCHRTKCGRITRRCVGDQNTKRKFPESIRYCISVISPRMVVVECKTSRQRQWQQAITRRTMSNWISYYAVSRNWKNFPLFESAHQSKSFVRRAQERTVDGRYQVGSSRRVVLHRFHQLERRFQRDPELKQKYYVAIEEL